MRPTSPSPCAKASGTGASAGSATSGSSASTHVLIQPGCYVAVAMRALRRAHDTAALVIVQQEPVSRVGLHLVAACECSGVLACLRHGLANPVHEQTAV